MKEMLFIRLDRISIAHETHAAFQKPGERDQNILTQTLVMAEYSYRLHLHSRHNCLLLGGIVCPLVQNGLDLIPGIGDAGDRLYLGAAAVDINPLPDDGRETDAPSKKPKTSV